MVEGVVAGNYRAGLLHGHLYGTAGLLTFLAWLVLEHVAIAVGMVVLGGAGGELVHDGQTTHSYHTVIKQLVGHFLCGPVVVLGFAVVDLLALVVDGDARYATGVGAGIDGHVDAGVVAQHAGGDVDVAMALQVVNAVKQFEGRARRYLPAVGQGGAVALGPAGDDRAVAVLHLDGVEVDGGAAGLDDQVAIAVQTQVAGGQHAHARQVILEGLTCGMQLVLRAVGAIRYGKLHILGRLGVTLNLEAEVGNGDLNAGLRHVVAEQRVFALAVIDTLNGQGVLLILVRDGEEVAVVVLLLVNDEVALVVVQGEGQEVVVTGDDHLSSQRS